MTRWAQGLLVLMAGATLRLGAQEPDMTKHLEEMSWQNTLYVLIDELEYAPAGEGRPASLDARLWYGGAYNRLWLRAEGSATTSLAMTQGEADVELLYGRLIHPFWDAVVGVRVDRSWEGESAGRTHLAAGVIGLSPYRFELEPTVLVSADGDISARLKAEYSVLITQRLVAEPALEVNLAAQSVPRFGVRSGLNDYSFGLRIRYEILREFAPYVGVQRERQVSGSASSTETQLVTGLRFWY